MASIRTTTRSDGTTAHQVLFRDADTGRQSSKTFADPEEADLLKRFLNANGQSFRLAERAVVAMRTKTPTVEAILHDHLDHLTGVEPGTVNKYRRISERHIIDQLGLIPVDKLTRRDVLNWFDNLAVAPKTKKNIHALLSAALERAVPRHISSNVAKGVSTPKTGAAAREPVFLTKDQFETLAETIDPRFELFLRFMVGSGLRYSEATALRRRDLRFDTNGRATARVSRAWKRTSEGMVVGGPKTRAGVRSVSLSRNLSELVAAHAETVSAPDLLFTRTHGGMLRNGHFHQYWWMPMKEKIGQRIDPFPTVHDLRHTHASWLIEAGVPLPVIQARLGHESITTTIGTYGHLAVDADARAADLLD